MKVVPYVLGSILAVLSVFPKCSSTIPGPPLNITKLQENSFENGAISFDGLPVELILTIADFLDPISLYQLKRAHPNFDYVLPEKCEWIPRLISFLGEQPRNLLFSTRQQLDIVQETRKSVDSLMGKCAPWKQLLLNDEELPRENNTILKALWEDRKLIEQLARAKLIGWSFRLWTLGSPWKHDNLYDFELLHNVLLAKDDPYALPMIKTFVSISNWKADLPLPETVPIGKREVDQFWTKIVNFVIEVPPKELDNENEVYAWVLDILRRRPQVTSGQLAQGPFDDLFYGQPWFLLYQTMLLGRPDFTWDLVQHGYTMSGCTSEWFLRTCLEWAEKRFHHSGLIHFFQ